MPLRIKQSELTIVTATGAETNAQVILRLLIRACNFCNPSAHMVYADACGLEPECDLLPCLKSYYIFTRNLETSK